MLPCTDRASQLTIDTNTHTNRQQLHREERKLLSRLLDDMASSNFLLLTVLLALAASGAMASDPSPLQDFCVADKDSHGMYFILVIIFICITL
jgi:hypothetical protein